MRTYTVSYILVSYLGGWDDLLKAFTLLVIVRIVTEAIASIVKNNNLSRLTLTLFSQEILEYILIGIGNLTDVYVISGESQIRQLIIIFYMLYEMKKIWDITLETGLPTP